MRFRNLRLVAAFLLLACYIALFLVLGERWLLSRKIALAFQFSPSVTHIGGKMLIAAVVAAATLLFGRVYCSLLCPAGLAQELFTRVGRRLKLLRLGYVKGVPPLAVLAPLALVVALLGWTALANQFDPVGLFGRLARPAGDSLRALASSGVFLIETSASLVLAAAALAVLPLFRGRWFCDRLCPVGATLAIAGSAPGFGVAIRRDKCVACGQCDKVCPSRCINLADKRVDSGRCLLCLDCVAVCKFDAIGYGRESRRTERRGFLHWLTAAAAAGFVFSRGVAGRRGAFSTVAGAEPPVAPPGSTGNIRHRQRCVDCQACVLSCPVGIIAAKPNAPGRPVLDYDRGYCQYNCVQCSASCPAGVFEPIDVERKHRIRVARTKLAIDRCVVVAKGTECGACAEVCPTHAVSMTDQGPGLPTLPDFDADYCIGCGACYHVCPAEPRAFVISGLDRHETSLGVRLVEHPATDAREIPETSGGDDGLADFPF